jgi:hypothetical protein
MTSYLLLGAGFSRNWGGWLASEAFEYLLGRQEIASNESLRRLLWKAQAKGGFEDALADLQEAVAKGNTRAAGDLQALQTAVVAMFDDMNTGYETRRSWEFSQDSDCSISKFLAQFEAIFTLNQDLLVEHHYLEHSPELLRQDRWDGAGMPGVRPGQTTTSLIGQHWQVLPEAEFKVDGRIQPYFKLHGSANWTAPGGNSTLIIGGNKLQAIAAVPILKWYQQAFKSRLCAGDARLMVIGYGFRDAHINALLAEAVADHGLKLFVIAPEGAGLARAVNPTRGGLYAPGTLDDTFERALIGASRRSLAEIFGSNGNELAKLYRFVNP